MAAQKFNTFFSILACLLLGGLIAVLLLRQSPVEPEVETTDSTGKEVRTLTVNTDMAEPGNSFTIGRTYTGVTKAKDVVDLGFARAGRVADILVDTGDRVSAGDVLAELDTSRLEMQRDKLEDALATQANRGPQGGAGVSETDLEMVKIDLEESVLEAPFDGVIAARQMSEGSVASPGMPVFRITRGDQLEVWIGLPAEVADTLSVGDIKTIQVAGTTYAAPLTAILPEVDLTTRTRTVIFTLDDEASAKQLPGQVARLELSRDIESEASGFWVPLTALTRETRGLWSVYTVAPDDPSPKPVERNFVEVVHVEGDRAWVRGTPDGPVEYVADGSFRIVPGQNVQVAGDPVPAEEKTPPEDEAEEGAKGNEGDEEGKSNESASEVPVEGGAQEDSPDENGESGPEEDAVQEEAQ